MKHKLTTDLRELSRGESCMVYKPVEDSQKGLLEVVRRGKIFKLITPEKVIIELPWHVQVIPEEQLQD